MGCQYSVEGTMILKNYENMDLDLEDLEEELGEIELTRETKDDVTKVEISGHYSMSYGTAVEIDKKLRAFSKHVVEPACFVTCCDDDPGEVWVGKQKDIARAKRARLVEQATELMKQLSPEEQQTVIANSIPDTNRENWEQAYGAWEEDTSEEPASPPAQL